jgi:D-tagatose-1,6-bisphosphate aldolase subunit GatZ/KbaZ
MYLDEILEAKERGETRGVAAVCSAHPYVIKQTLMSFERPLIEATCNQVNQYGGYSGMRPADFIYYVNRIARENNFPPENIILGGDHLGPSVWQAEPACVAMAKAEVLVRDYVDAGFVKIHLDCSMGLSDDPAGTLDVELSAKRTARLAKIAEHVGNENLRYVIGTEVPIPGGAMHQEEGVCVSRLDDIKQTIEVTRQAFYSLRLQGAWERVIAIVVQPGVEFGDDFVFPYKPNEAKDLSLYIRSQPLVYEAHSTDYQSRQSLEDLVNDHFAILKVGPALTFAFREAVFALAMMENELYPLNERSNIVSLLDEIMVQQPAHWKKYYRGDEQEKEFKRKYSLSDRIRYYWTEPRVHKAFEKMMLTLHQKPLPFTLLKQFVPDVYSLLMIQTSKFSPEYIVLAKIQKVLDDYVKACVPR